MQRIQAQETGGNAQMHDQKPWHFGLLEAHPLQMTEASIGLFFQYIRNMCLTQPVFQVAFIYIGIVQIILEGRFCSRAANVTSQKF